MKPSPSRSRRFCERHKCAISSRNGAWIRYLLNRRQARGRTRRRDGSACRDAAVRDWKHLRLREESRDAWGWLWLDRMQQDLRYALRTLRKTPALSHFRLHFALGIGVNLALFQLLILLPCAGESARRCDTSPVLAGFSHDELGWSFLSRDAILQDAQQRAFGNHYDDGRRCSLAGRRLGPCTCALCLRELLYGGRIQLYGRPAIR